MTNRNAWETNVGKQVSIVLHEFVVMSASLTLYHILTTIDKFTFSLTIAGLSVQALPKLVIQEQRYNSQVVNSRIKGIDINDSLAKEGQKEAKDITEVSSVTVLNDVKTTTKPLLSAVAIKMVLLRHMKNVTFTSMVV